MMKERGIAIPMQNVLVTSDIHGHNEELNGLLSKWEPEKELLLFLGDYCDRGDDSHGVFQTVKRLVEAGQAVAIGGNHEELFLSFLDYPETESDSFYANGGVKTIKSFYPESERPQFEKTPEQWAELIKQDFAELVDFIRELPFYIEMGDWLFVHAGVNPFQIDWKSTSDIDFRWIRERFYLRKNETGKRIMFGHTPIPILPYGAGLPIWTNRDQTLFGIDGGMGSNIILNGIRIENGEIKELVAQLYQDEAIVVDKENLFKRESLV